MLKENADVPHKGRIAHVLEFDRDTSGILDPSMPLHGPQPEDAGACRQKISGAVAIPFQFLSNHRARPDQRHLSP